MEKMETISHKCMCGVKFLCKENFPEVGSAGNSIVVLCTAVICQILDKTRLCAIPTSKMWYSSFDVENYRKMYSSYLYYIQGFT